jgi:electron transfer flavoprotein beta subunit
MGDENSKEALKHALAMGCDEAVIVSDPALTSVDTLVASHVLAAAIKKIAGSEPAASRHWCPPPEALATASLH